MPSRGVWLLLFALASPSRSLVAAGAAKLVSGETLPQLEAKALSGQLVALPRDARGHGVVLVFGFSKAAAKITRPWVEGCRAAAAAQPDVYCYDLRMVEAVPRPFRGAMERGMRNGLPVDAQRQTLPVYQENAAWRERLAAADDENAYVVACDGEGRVRATAVGPFIDAELKDLLKAGVGSSPR